MDDFMDMLTTWTINHGYHPKNWNLMSLGANYGHGHWVSSGFLQISGSVLWNPSRIKPHPIHIIPIISYP